MDSLMLLGGQFLQARTRGEHGFNCKGNMFWEEVDAVERGVFDAYNFALRLAAAFVVLGALFIGLGAASPSDRGTAQTACLECPAAPGQKF